MKRSVFLPLAMLVGCGAAQTATSTTGPTIGNAEPTGAEAFSAWRARRVESLAGEEGWLTLVALCWLDDTELTIGSAESATCRLTEHAAPEVGRVVRDESGVRFLAGPGIDVRSAGEPVTEVALISDAAPEPTVLEVGPLRMHLIDRGGRLGIRIKDRESAARRSFTEVPVYDYDPALRIPARFVPAAAGATLPIVNVLGMEIAEEIAGQLTFELGGRSYTMVAMPGGDAPEDGLFLMLRDATSGETTYGAGRYLDVPQPDASGATFLDLNFLETPPCGFTDLATCPLPPPENEVETAIEAGERWLGDH